MKKDPANPIYSVSQLNRFSKMLLEDHFPAVLVEGEISNLANPASGHWYLTLKDSSAQLRCAMFRNRNMMVRMKPKNGMRVLVKGKLSLYEGRGDYQLILEQMEETGAGALRQAFEELQMRLQAEGLFDPAHKQALPALSQHLAVISSPTGAAIHDVLSVLKRRFPALLVTIVPVSVQGKQAAGEIIRALSEVNRRKGCLSDVDTILLTRGGGSLEDLWSFNDEALARAIFASALPVVSAVGHEVDFTIADFVADVRAPTPSAAAELLSPDQQEYRQKIERFGLRLSALTSNRIKLMQFDLLKLRKRLQHPGRRLMEHAQRLDELEGRLKRSAANIFLHKTRQLHLLHGALKSHSPAQRLQSYRQGLNASLHRLRRAMDARIKNSSSALREQCHALNTISPLATLSRGYSISSTESGEIIRSYEQVNTGDTIQTRLADGNIVSVVKKGVGK